MDVTRTVPIPAGSVLPSQLARIDYRDAYAVALPLGSSADPEEWTRRLFADPPGWIGRLMRLRDTLVRPLGLRTTDRHSPTPFPALLVTDREVVFGKDDRHLDFRGSVHTDGTALTVSTVVQWNNAVGRAYFLPVRPFHRVLIRSLLRRAVG